MTKTQLKEVRKLNKEIESLKRNRERLFYSVLGTSTKLNDIKVQSSIGGDKFGDTVAGLADLDKQILDSIDHLIRLQAQALDEINKLSKSEYRTILIEYYLNGCDWEEVASAVGYSVQHTLKLHGEALEEII